MGSKGTDLAGTEDGIDSCPWMLADLCSFLLSASAAFSLAALSLPRSQARNLIFNSSQSVHLLGMAAWRKTGSALSVYSLSLSLPFLLPLSDSKRKDWIAHPKSWAPSRRMCGSLEGKGLCCPHFLSPPTTTWVEGIDALPPSFPPSVLLPSLPLPLPPLHRVTHTGICKIYNQE